MSRHEEKEKMMEELFSKRRSSFSNIYNDSVDILKDTENELKKNLLQNKKDIKEKLVPDRQAKTEVTVGEMSFEIQKISRVVISGYTRHFLYRQLFR